MARTNRLNKLATLAVASGIMLSGTPAADARDHLYGVLDHEGLLECENLHWAGNHDAADNCYRALLATASAPEVRAEAAWALDDKQQANALFQTASGNNDDNPLIPVRWGELFLQTYQYQDAFDMFSEALEIAPDNAWAHLGAALALREGGSADSAPTIDQHMAAVLDHFASPPGARLRAMLTSAHAAMEQDNLERAADMLDDARNLAGDEDLPAMRIDALEAGLAFLKREDPQPHIDAALEEAPGYGDAYAIPGYFASITRRYRESRDFYQQAVDIEPDNWNAHLELGQNHMRLNNMETGIRHVEIAYQGDAFSPKATNLMRLLDTFSQDFTTVNYPQPPAGDGVPELTLRLHEDEEEVLSDYARQLSMDSIDTFSERYDFEPAQPVVIELFPNHEDFVVRSLGMPGVGILGVTFGYVVAMDSPSGHPRESYHWGTTLWHEMAHVFTLEASDHGVPRWFSEGVSVYEEWNTGPTPGVKIPADVLMAMAEDRFLPVGELDDGFMRPSYSNQVMVSYMQAGLIFQFISQEYGHDKIVEMLYDFSDGTDTVTAIESSLGISERDFNRHFEQYIDIEYGTLLGNLQVWNQDLQTAAEAYAMENWEAAVEAADKAIFTFPDYVDVDSPYVIKARSLSRLGRQEEKFETLQTYWRKGGSSPNALKELADDYLAQDDHDNAMQVLTEINWGDPYDVDVHNKLGDLYLENGRPERALREFEVALALDPLDKADANYRIAKAHNALDNSEQTMDYLMSALGIAPQYRPAQQLLLELSRSENAVSDDQEQ